MLNTLPPSLDRDRHTVAREVERSRGLTPEERLRIVASLCEDALVLLRMNPNRERLLAYRDPVPESTRAVYRRLRLPR